MKKTAILSASLFLFFTATAQQAHFGLKGGVNVSQLHFNDAQISSDSKVGLHFGVLAHIHTSKTWALQPELLYSLEGAKKIGNCRNHLQFELPECSGIAAIHVQQWLQDRRRPAAWIFT